MAMKQIKVSEATDPALDWLVAKCEWVEWTFETATTAEIVQDCHYSTNWAQGGPIIERERISLQHLGDRIGWGARWPIWVPDGDGETIPAASGPTPLIAAMRCYVASKLGDTVEVPEELL